MNTTIRKIVNTRIFWIVISVLFSVILWCYVTMEQGAKIEQTFSDITVIFSGEPFIYYSGRSYGVDHTFPFAAYGLFV